MKRKILLFLVSLCVFTGCSPDKLDNKVVDTTVKLPELKQENIIENQTEDELVLDDVEEIVAEEIIPEEYNLSLVAAGDNLYHKTVYKKGLKDDGTYNFDFVYENIKPFIESFDLAIINQETVLVEDRNNISSYPCFGTPQEVGDAIINAGFDVVLNATNHTYDKKETGVLNSIAFWDNHPDITYLGIHKDEDDFNTVKIIEKNNIKIALLNYTYGLNGFVIPDEKYYLVDTLYDKDKIQKDLEFAEQNADITIVFPHWGNEYQYKESSNQIEWAQFFTQYGADIIIGAHPHVVEPVKYIQAENGNISLCYYSLGNFVSGQDEKPRILGGLATLNIKKIVDGENVEITIENANFIPTVTHYNSNEHTIYLLSDYNDELANNTRLGASCEYLWNLWNEINSTTEINLNN